MYSILSISINAVTDFFNHPIFVIFGGISTILIVLGFCYTGYLNSKGILPVLYRVGTGLARRKIAIFAQSEYESLKSLLLDTNLFLECNIIRVNRNDLQKVSDGSMFLVHWKDYHDKIDDILRIKKDSTSLIVYAPNSEGLIEREEMEKINSYRNSLVVNFRGRLLNDIVISLITTGVKR